MKKVFLSSTIILALLSCNGNTSGDAPKDSDSIIAEETQNKQADNTEMPTYKVIEGMKSSEISHLGIKAHIEEGKVSWTANREKYLKAGGFLFDEFYRETQTELETELDKEKAIGVYLCQMDDMEAMIIVGSNHTVHLANLSFQLGHIDFHIGKVIENFDATKIEMDKKKNVAVAYDNNGNKKEIAFTKNLPYDCEFESGNKHYNLSMSSVYTINLDFDYDTYRGTFRQQGNKVIYSFNEVVKGESAPETLEKPITGSFTYNSEDETFTFGENKFGISKGTPISCEIFPIFG
ncbi:MAG: hypothetical protein MJZ41_12600 [Bacteroidaceae bacterium]|nr:hypothetical protein [Bacteroidaceae bacterium]